LPSLEGGRLPAVEILIANSAIRNAIRENKAQMVNTTLQTSSDIGMRTLEMDLASLVKKGKISLETAQAFSLRPEELMSLTKEK